jgi:hypothetical protein
MFYSSQPGKRKKDNVGRENVSELEKKARCEQGPEIESDSEYEQNEEVNGILIQKLNKEKSGSIQHINSSFSNRIILNSCFIIVRCNFFY